MFSTDKSPSLALMLTLIEGLGLRQIAARILHELALGVRAAEAVGLALDRRIYGAIRLHVLVIGETPGTHVAELAGHRIGRTGKADDEDAGYEILFHFGRSFRFGRPPATQLYIRIRETFFTRPFAQSAALAHAALGAAQGTSRKRDGPETAGTTAVPECTASRARHRAHRHTGGTRHAALQHRTHH